MTGEKFWPGYYEGDWFHYVLSWWEHCDSKNILFLKYEDLTKDTVGILKHIVQFLDIELGQEKSNEILEKVQFQTMKSDNVLGDVKEIDKFFRKGKVGAWKVQFTVAQNGFFG
ncbi:hypothetical protein ASPVEDRAFT_79681 [Aspergillus versicolor CBS 583.65]|uniref:Sulfotransferase domain-containing protein n=1 Tax=Aspergillus versicolor CBS 583.65 TaxID=1036611 RepID=A0A1L9P917_ASPVE|nr:uncharacterized protein ASPVEDRAFT_79681 [Aspergillus versicolor CBS 583.65]OJI98011.1 hypothetical protein ASPVEDRAFT_79681 [Aspergillus versicolor CBS 583.65]